MKKEFKILIADKNSNVRDFLKREMTAEGYIVKLAENGREVLKWAYHADPVDILILDPDLPDAEESLLLKKLNLKTPYIPVILHTFFSDYIAISRIFDPTVFIEKGGNSIEQLKKVIAGILNKTSGADIKKGN
ncbi:response regulator [Desulfobacterium sp. N47]|uniref:response regulator n=1 Tax=Desulfobacterium sp. N47 TaxID=3115210 RepID=UPI003CB3EE87